MVIYRLISNSTSYFLEADARAGGNECEGDVVDRLRRLQEDVCSEFIVINDEDFRIRNAMEAWMDGIAKLSNNLGATNPSAYMRNATVFQLGRGATPRSVNSDGERNAVLAEYEFIDIFPTNISQIDLSYDSSDTIEEFTVEFQVQSFNLNASGGPDD